MTWRVAEGLQRPRQIYRTEEIPADAHGRTAVRADDVEMECGRRSARMAILYEGGAILTWPLVVITYDCDETQLEEWALRGVADFIGGVGPYTFSLWLSTDEENTDLHTLTLMDEDENDVATGSIEGDGEISLTQLNGSGISGSVILAYDSDIEGGALDISYEAIEPIEEDDAGTYYTPWVDLVAGPIAQGYFGLPDCELDVADPTDPEETPETATVTVEFEDEDEVTEDLEVAELDTEGALRPEAVAVFFQLSGGKLVKRLRFKVVSGAKVYWELSGGVLTFYGASL
jgi:hypothetical protein